MFPEDVLTSLVVLITLVFVETIICIISLVPIRYFKLKSGRGIMTDCLNVGRDSFFSTSRLLEADGEADVKTNII